ncbi:hypothetical protein O3M35_000143 [Rhynocoris fuscipes]|uniref:Uncharacterized protein n=1 Tax=Rhynocoris fuscipes TaxID=488301 RepID=A0AAW1DL32_9HEMI
MLNQENPSTQAELNGFIENSPIYVTSYPPPTATQQVTNQGQTLHHQEQQQPHSITTTSPVSTGTAVTAITRRPTAATTALTTTQLSNGHAISAVTVQEDQQEEIELKQDLHDATPEAIRVARQQQQQQQQQQIEGITKSGVVHSGSEKSVSGASSVGAANCVISGGTSGASGGGTGSLVNAASVIVSPQQSLDKVDVNNRRASSPFTNGRTEVLIGQDGGISTEKLKTTALVENNNTLATPPDYITRFGAG